LWIKEDILNANKYYNFTKEQIETVLNFRYYFSNNEMYKSRQSKRFSFIERLLKEKEIKYFIWNVEDYVRLDSIYTIREDTNGLISDFHWSFNGHKDFADIIYKKITNNLNII